MVDSRSNVWGTVAACAAVGVTCIGGTYKLTRDIDKDQLEQYEKSESWRLPQLLKDLGTVSANLAEQLKNSAELERLRAFERQYSAQFNQLQSEYDVARRRLAAVEGETVEIKSGETIPLGEPGLLLGCDHIGYSGADCRVGEKTLSLRIGERATYDASVSHYVISLKALEGGNEKAQFVIVREKR